MLVIIASVTSWVGLPSLEGSKKKPAHFGPVLRFS
jgi:hypothetical protein